MNGGEALTLITQGEIAYLGELATLAKRWDGPIAGKFDRGLGLSLGHWS